MVETAAHVVDHVFPRLPVRQWVLSLPKRRRYFLQREPAAVNAVLQLFFRIVERTLRARRADAQAAGNAGAARWPV